MLHPTHELEPPANKGRFKMTTSEIKAVSKSEASCQRLMTIPGIGPIISTAVVAAVGTGEAYDRGRDFAAWL